MPEHKIDRLGHLGDGVARGPIYAPLTLPGELISGTVENGRILAAKILEPSSHRVTPACPHYQRCGGCAIQHANDGFVSTWKAQMVEQALRDTGINASVRKVHNSPPNSRRRATFSGRRTKSGTLVGFHGRSSETIIDVPVCKTLSQDVLDTMPALQALTAFGASRKSPVRLSVTASLNGADVAVSEAKAMDREIHLSAVAIAEKWKLARLTWNDEVVVERVPPVQSFDRIQVIPPVGAFLQATEHGQTTLMNAVKRIVGSAKRVADLFAGCGTFALPLARNADIHAVESDPEMLAALDTAWRKALNLHQVNCEERDLFRRPLLSEELAFDAVVIDPPRAGAAAQIAQLAKSQVSTIAMVSCNPNTFARDARVLCDAGFAIDDIDVVDQFRWSPHIELVAAFRR